MMGHCDDTMNTSVTFAASTVTVNYELEPWFTIPTDDEIFTFGTGG